MAVNWLPKGPLFLSAKNHDISWNFRVRWPEPGDVQQKHVKNPHTFLTIFEVHTHGPVWHGHRGERRCEGGSNHIVPKTPTGLHGGLSGLFVRRPPLSVSIKQNTMSVFHSRVFSPPPGSLKLFSSRFVHSFAHS